MELFRPLNRILSMQPLIAVSGSNQTLSPVSPDRPLTNGIANKLNSGDRDAHDWYRFVLSFPPHLVRHYLQKFELNSKHQVLDPFCGTGTTIVECKKLGIPSIGVEANPMAHFASHVKTSWNISADKLTQHVKAIAETTRKQLAHSQTKNLRTLPEESQKVLLKNSISPIPLHKTLVLLEQIRKHNDKQLEQYELLALAKALVTTIGNLHFGPEVGVGPAKKDAPVVDLWLSYALSMADDLRQLETQSSASCRVIHHDARDILAVLKPNSIDAVITSPPYPNEKDYTRTTRLESVLLGLITNKQELQAFKRNLLRSNTRNVYRGDTDDSWISNYPEIHKIAAQIEARRIALKKTSGFERMYPRVTKLYFGGMARHLSDLREVLRPGAQLAYVVGDQASYLRVMIRTGQLIGQIAESLGYELIGIDLFRTRLSTTTKQQLREEVVLLRWPEN